MIKRLLRPIANFFRKIVFKLMQPVTNKLIVEIRNSANASSMMTAVRNSNIIPYYSGEKIRILFIFQMLYSLPTLF